MFKDGGGGQLLVRTVHRGRTWGRNQRKSRHCLHRGGTVSLNTNADTQGDGQLLNIYIYKNKGVKQKLPVVTWNYFLIAKLQTMAFFFFAFVCKVDCFHTLTDSSAGSDGWWEWAEHKTTSETNTDNTQDTAAGGQAWGLRRQKVDKLLPILFLPERNHNRKERET